MKSAPQKTSSIEALEKFMKDNSLARKDLEELVGSRGRVSEILSGKRPLSLTMIKNLVNVWGMNANLLLKDHPAKTNPSPLSSDSPEAKKSIVWMLD